MSRNGHAKGALGRVEWTCKASTGQMTVTVHIDPPLRCHRDRQPATPLRRCDVRAGIVVDAGAGHWHGQDTPEVKGGRRQTRQKTPTVKPEGTAGGGRLLFPPKVPPSFPCRLVQRLSYSIQVFEAIFLPLQHIPARMLDMQVPIRIHAYIL